MRISVAVTPGMSCARPTAGAARTAAEAATSWRRLSMFIVLPFFLLFIPWPYRLAEGRFLPPLPSAPDWQFGQVKRISRRGEQHEAVSPSLDPGDGSLARDWGSPHHVQQRQVWGNAMWHIKAPFGRRRLLATAALAPAAARAQDTADWPNRPVRIVVPYPPGGPNDIIARLYAQALGPILKQTVLVENRAGGSGITGTDYVLKSTADGYTFGIIDGGWLTILPHTTQNALPRAGGRDTDLRRDPRAGGAGGASEPRREKFAGAVGTGQAP